MTKQKKNTLLTVIIYVLVIALLAGIIVFILRLTNGGTDDFKTFYVTDEAGNIYATTDSETLPCSAVTRFNVKYTFDSNDKGYTVKVVPNETTETAFEYTVAGETYEYGSEDLTKAFNVVTYGDYFTIEMPETMQEALQAVYPGKTVTVPSDVKLTQPYFKLVVTSYSGNNEITILLKSYSYIMYLTPDTVIF